VRHSARQAGKIGASDPVSGKGALYQESWRIVMPIYEYRCSACHRIFEEWSRQAEEASVAHSCPLCGREARRLISHTSFSLKGQGWYVTDYGARKNEKENSGASASPLPPPSPPSSAEAASLSASPARTSSENVNAASS
jgi:putative FmdB family regulatory protein